MLKHWECLKYTIRHKWFVFLGCKKHGLFWVGVIHDLSKFLPSEWNAYVDFYHHYANSPLGTPKKHLDASLLKHIHRNPHHWQYWILNKDNGTQKCLSMPHRYRVEMLCDWNGIALALPNDATKTLDWYIANRNNITLHKDTRDWVEREIGYEEKE